MKKYINRDKKTKEFVFKINPGDLIGFVIGSTKGFVQTQSYQSDTYRLISSSGFAHCNGWYSNVCKSWADVEQFLDYLGAVVYVFENESELLKWLSEPYEKVQS